jgi:hypothetical protein
MGVKMTGISADINKRILDKIEESDCDDAVKKFLRKILIFELGRRRGEEYARRYEREIDICTKEFRED